MRTTKGTKRRSTKRGPGKRAGKRTGPSRTGAAGPKTLADYRRQHKKIPGSVYRISEKKTQVIHKTNYAPLGRPPSDPKARSTYNKARMRATPTKEEEVERKARNEEYAHRRYMEAYEDWRAERFMTHVDSEYVDSELEDRGYADTRKNWRQTGRRTKTKAWMKEAEKEARDREYEMYGYGYDY